MNLSLSSMLSLLGWSFSTVEALAAPTSIVTGANGYVGREVARALLQQDSTATVMCLVRPHRIDGEKKYWNSSQVHVLPYDMNDGGETLENALQEAKKINEQAPICVYHVASVFGPTEDPVQTALENVKGTEDLVRSMAKFDGCRLVLTSSMAAVRGTGQEPLNGKYYTFEDWNTLSKLDANNWGSCYQWSKAESERRAWELAESLRMPMSTICPSFVFGPGQASSSFSVQLVAQWIRGKSPVQSRLCVDVRDVAKAHVEAGTRSDAVGKRFLVTTEARVSSEATAQVLKKVCQEERLGDPEKIHFDSAFQGGSIPIGEKEVEAVERLELLLGLKLRSVEETIGEMARVLLHADCQAGCS
jgi:nucleoside-diphosphate-sugar epimerase